MFNVVTRANVAFQLGKEIGTEGKNSKAFLARDGQLGADIVIKQIEKSSLSNPDDFYRESRALYASAHPNVVQVHYACEDGANIFIAMPFYKNGSVRALMAQRHLSAREVTTIGCQIMSGLHNIHSKGLVHFDIKADNVLLSDRHEALISDFGLCKPLTNGFATPDGIYEPNWPPEALEKQEFDARYDIFQAGLTLYAMCIGLGAFKEQYEAYFIDSGFDQKRFWKDITSGSYPNRDLLPPHIPSRLKKAIKTCLEVKPENRYQTALEAMNALANVEGAELDWLYSSSDGERVWKKDCQGVKYVFTVSSDNTATLTKAVATGVARRVSGGSFAAAKPRDIAKVLGTYN